MQSSKDLYNRDEKANLYIGQVLPWPEHKPKDLYTPVITLAAEKRRRLYIPQLPYRLTMTTKSVKSALPYTTPLTSCDHFGTVIKRLERA